MEIQVLEDGTTEFREVSGFLMDLLRRIPLVGASSDSRVEDRFFPPPATGADEEGLREDWSAFVQPELLTTFREAREVVQADLRLATEEENAWIVRIPIKHINAWLNALNQARLSLAEEHSFDEDALSKKLPTSLESSHDLALLQMHFYGMIQEWFVSFLD